MRIIIVLASLLVITPLSAAETDLRACYTKKGCLPDTEFYKSCHKSDCFVGNIVKQHVNDNEVVIVDTVISGPKNYKKVGKFEIHCTKDGLAVDLLNHGGTSQKIKPRIEKPDRFQEDAYNVWWLRCEQEPNKSASSD